MVSISDFLKTVFFTFGLLATVLLEGQDTLVVDNSKALLAGLKSNNVLLLNANHFELPEETELLLKGISNLQLIGIGDNYVKLTTRSSHNAVMHFQKCKNIRLENLSLGHWPEEGYCTGDVLILKECHNIRLDHCDLFGSGVIGLNVNLSRNIWCKDIVIRDCSENIILPHFLGELVFEDCRFYLKEGNQFDYASARFIDCDFYSPDGSIMVAAYDGYFPEEPLSIDAEVVTTYPAWKQDLIEGEYESICPGTIDVMTSSQLNSVKNEAYSSQNLLVQNPEKAWVEGETSDGIGEQIVFTCVREWAEYENWGISGEFKIVNGYSKSEALWQANGRVKQFKVYRNDRVIAIVNLMDSPNLQTFGLHKALGGSHWSIGERISFEITAVYKGSKYSDTAVSLFLPTCSP